MKSCRSGLDLQRAGVKPYGSGQLTTENEQIPLSGMSTFHYLVVVVLTHCHMYSVSMEIRRFSTFISRGYGFCICLEATKPAEFGSAAGVPRRAGSLGRCPKCPPTWSTDSDANRSQRHPFSPVASAVARGTACAGAGSRFAGPDSVDRVHHGVTEVGAARICVCRGFFRLFGILGHLEEPSPVWDAFGRRSVYVGLDSRLQVSTPRCLRLRVGFDGWLFGG